MARKNKRNRQDRPASNRKSGSFLAVLGFVVLIVASVFWTIAAFNNLFDSINISIQGLGVVQLLLNIAIVGVIAIAAYPFARSRNKVWWVIYWVVVAIALAGAIFGGVVGVTML